MGVKGETSSASINRFLKPSRCVRSRGFSIPADTSPDTPHTKKAQTATHAALAPPSSPMGNMCFWWVLHQFNCGTRTNMRRVERCVIPACGTSRHTSHKHVRRCAHTAQLGRAHGQYTHCLTSNNRVALERCRALTVSAALARSEAGRYFRSSMVLNTAPTPQGRTHNYAVGQPKCSARIECPAC